MERKEEDTRKGWGWRMRRKEEGGICRLINKRWSGAGIVELKTGRPVFVHEKKEEREKASKEEK